MKIKSFIIIAVLIIAALSACGAANEKEYEIMTDRSLEIQLPYDHPGFIADSYYKDAQAPQTMQVEIKGKTYDGKYDSTQSEYGTTYRFYETADNGFFSVDDTTDEVISYSIPYCVEAKTEEEYLAIIQKEILSELDLSTYTYLCCTVYRNESGSLQTNGFYVCADDEEVSYYEFVYTQSIGGYNTDNSVRIIFYNDRLIVHDRTRDYTKDSFSGIIANLKTIEDDVCNHHLQSGITKGCKILSVGKPAYHTLFLKDGTPYISMVVKISYMLPGHEETIQAPLTIWVKYNG